MGCWGGFLLPKTCEKTRQLENFPQGFFPPLQKVNLLFNFVCFCIYVSVCVDFPGFCLRFCLSFFRFFCGSVFLAGGGRGGKGDAGGGGTGGASFRELGAKKKRKTGIRKGGRDG